VLVACWLLLLLLLALVLVLWVVLLTGGEQVLLLGDEQPAAAREDQQEARVLPLDGPVLHHGPVLFNDVHHVRDGEPEVICAALDALLRDVDDPAGSGRSRAGVSPIELGIRLKGGASPPFKLWGLSKQAATELRAPAGDDTHSAQASRVGNE